MSAALTIAVYLSVSIFLLKLARAFVRPIGWPARLGLILLPFCFLGKALLTGRIYAPVDLPFQAQPWASARQLFGVNVFHNPTLSDLYCQIIPWRKAVRWAFFQGEWPLWNPFILCGDILAASAQPAPYYPLNIASLLLPLDLSLSFLAAATFLLAAVSAFLFMRELGCREEIAILGGAAWCFSSFLVFWHGWPLGATAAPFPLLLLGARRIAREPGWRSTILLTAGLVLVNLAGHPETMLHAVATASVYGLFQLSSVRRKMLAAVYAIGGGMLSLLLTAFFLLPILEALPQSEEHLQRRVVYSQQDRSVSLAEAWQRARPNFIPFVYGSSQGDIVPRRRFPGLVPQSSAYGGSLLLGLAIYGGVKSRNRERWFFLGLFILGIAAGASSPVVADVLARLPFFAIAINERLVFVAAFSMATLGCLGAEAWARARADTRLGLLILVLFCCLGLWTAIIWPEMRSWGLSAGFLTGRALTFLGPLVVAGAILSTTRRVYFGLAVLLALLLAQRVVEDGDLYPTLSRESFFPLVAPLDVLPASTEPYRVIGRAYALTPNTSTMYEIEDARGYQALTNRRLAHTFQLWAEPQPAWFNRVDELSRPFLSFLNVRFAVEPYGKPLARHWRLRSRAAGSRLVVNRRVLTRAFVPREVRVGLSEEEILQEMSEEHDFGARAWISGTAWDGIKEPRTLLNGPGTVRTLRQGSGYQLSVDLAGPGWVVISETGWAGWKARRLSTGGEELRIDIGNYAFLAVHLPAGRHEVEVKYRPDSFVVGLSVSAVTLIALTFVGIMRRLHRREVLVPRSPH